MDPNLRERLTTPDHLANALRAAIFDGQFLDNEELNQVGTRCFLWRIAGAGAEHCGNCRPRVWCKASRTTEPSFRP